MNDEDIEALRTEIALLRLQSMTLFAAVVAITRTSNDARLAIAAAARDPAGLLLFFGKLSDEEIDMVAQLVGALSAAAPPRNPEAAAGG